MGFREHVRIDAQREARLAFQFLRTAGEKFQFRFALHVELQDAGLEGAIDFRFSLAHARENHAVRGFRRGGQHPFQFSSRNDVKPGAAIGKKLENGQRGVGLHGVTHQGVAVCQRFLEQPQPLRDLVAGIDVERRPELPREGFKGNRPAGQSR